jgi:hypothetical protein
MDGREFVTYLKRRVRVDRSNGGYVFNLSSAFTKFAAAGRLPDHKGDIKLDCEQTDREHL